MREGRDPFSGVQVRLLVQLFFNWTFKHEDPGSAFHLHSILLGEGLYFAEETAAARKGHVTLP